MKTTVLTNTYSATKSLEQGRFWFLLRVGFSVKGGQLKLILHNQHGSTILHITKINYILQRLKDDYLNLNLKLTVIASTNVRISENVSASMHIAQGAQQIRC